MGAGIISLIDFDNNTIYEDRFSSLPIKEDGIISESMELFHDGEPCIIYRTYITKKFFQELENYLECMLKKGIEEVDYDILPGWVKKMLDIESKTKKLLIRAC
jgi:hypothetical protein